MQSFRHRRIRYDDSVAGKVSDGAAKDSELYEVGSIHPLGKRHHLESCADLPVSGDRVVLLVGDPPISGRRNTSTRACRNRPEEKRRNRGKTSDCTSKAEVFFRCLPNAGSATQVEKSGDLSGAGENVF
jgi:hypothetical protein